MSHVGIPAADRESIFRSVAAVLHLGNIAFGLGPDGESSVVLPGTPQEHLVSAGGAHDPSFPFIEQ